MILQETGLLNWVTLYRGIERIVVTNGCFDILHAGHVRLFEFCVKHGRVIVLINSDESVARLKGPERPIVPLEQRMEMVDAIKHVHIVTPFAEDTPARLIQAIRPEVLVKGADYKGKPVAGSEWAEQLVLFEHEVAVSTSKIVEACKR